MAKIPRITVTDRNVNATAIMDSDPRYRRGIDSPFGIGSTPIDLKDSGRIARWFNSNVMADHVWRAKQIGYDPITPDELANPEQAGAFHTDPAGFIVRGERGQEVLLSIPKVVHDARQMAKAEKNLKDMRDFDKEKTRMVEAAAAKYGGQAGDYLNDHVGPIGTVRTNVERIQRTEEPGDE